MTDLTVLKKAHQNQERLLNKLSNSDLMAEADILEQLLSEHEREIVFLRQALSDFYLINPKDKNLNADCSSRYYGIVIKDLSSTSHRKYLIELPFLLPNRRTAPTNFKRTLVKSLREDLKRFCDIHNVQPLDNASVTFISYYIESSERKMRHDNDNTEISAVLNALTGFLLADDSSTCCDLHLLSRTALLPSTKILIESKKKEEKYGTEL